MSNGDNAASGAAARQPEQSKCSELASVDEGDAVYTEFALATDTGVYGVEGTVDNINEWTCEDGRTKGRAVEMWSEHVHFEYVKLRQIVDPETGEGFVEDVLQLRRRGEDSGERHPDADVQVVEVRGRV